MPKSIIKGCYVGIPTPMQQKGCRTKPGIDYDVLDRHMKYLLEGGIDGVVVAGCTGADATLDEKEQVALVKYVKENFGSRTDVIAGDGANSTWEAIELAKRMEGEAGVFEHLQISPSRVRPSDAGIIEHYITVADSIEGEVILCSVPSRTGGSGIMPYVVERLAEHPKIICIEEASGDIERVRETIAMTSDKEFSVLSGSDALTLDIIKAGGTGAISVAANVFPDVVGYMVRAALGSGSGEPDYDFAEKQDAMLRPLYAALSSKSADGNPSPNPCTVHYALKKLGRGIGLPRLPLGDITEMEKDAIDKAVRSIYFKVTGTRVMDPADTDEP